MNSVQKKLAVGQKSAIGALLNVSNRLQTVARRVELREPAVSKPFYAASCYLKTAAAITVTL